MVNKAQKLNITTTIKFNRKVILNCILEILNTFESVGANSLFSDSHIPLNKAFYLIVLSKSEN